MECDFLLLIGLHLSTIYDIMLLKSVFVAEAMSNVVCNGDMILSVCEVRYTGINVLFTNMYGSCKMNERKSRKFGRCYMDEHRNYAI